jgi:hypothetical protein
MEGLSHEIEMNYMEYWYLYIDALVGKVTVTPLLSYKTYN